MPIQGDRIYRGVIHKARTEKREKEGGGVTSWIKVRVQVPDHGFADTELYFTPDAIVRTKKTLSELNPEIWDGTYPFLLRDPAPFLVGRPCKIETENHVFENARGVKEYSIRVKWLNGVPDGQAATEDDVSRILAMMGIDDTYTPPTAPEASEPTSAGDEPF